MRGNDLYYRPVQIAISEYPFFCVTKFCRFPLRCKRIKEVEGI